MPLQQLMYGQVAELAAFFEPGPVKVWLLQHPADLKDMIVKILVGLKDDPDNANVYFAYDMPFENADQYFGAIREDFESELEELVGEFHQVGIKLPAIGKEKGTALERLARRVDAIANLFPKGGGSLVFLMRPESIGDEPKLAEALKQLGELAKAPHAKYTLIYAGTGKEIGEVPTFGDPFGGQMFQVSAEKIEAQLNLDLQRPDLVSIERMQYTAMAGAIAFSKGELDKALKLQKQVLDLAGQHGDDVDSATGLYNLGNTHLRKEEYDKAEESFTEAAELCLKAENDNLLAMVVINLGVAMQRQDKLDEALVNFDAGRSLFKALQYPAGEIHALDSKAASLFAAKKNDEAEVAWREALEVANGIPDEPLADLRESCVEDITDKLRRFFEHTGQSDKARSLPAAAES